MAATQQKSLVLILARELAANIATPLFIVDAQGNLVFYNEPAEQVLGRRFADAGAMSREEWGTMFSPEHDDGTPIPPDELPLTIALSDKRPSHLPFCVTGLDGVRRRIEVTAYPLFARTEDFVGAIAIFWESPQRS